MHSIFFCHRFGRSRLHNFPWLLVLLLICKFLIVKRGRRTIWILLILRWWLIIIWIISLKGFVQSNLRLFIFLFQLYSQLLYLQLCFPLIMQIRLILSLNPLYFFLEQLSLAIDFITHLLNLLRKQLKFFIIAIFHGLFLPLFAKEFTRNICVETFAMRNLLRR
jgi:hypothetical protein